MFKTEYWFFKYVSLFNCIVIRDGESIELCMISYFRLLYAGRSEPEVYECLYL